MKAKNLIGRKFGRLTVTARAPNLSSGNPRWECRCDCGEVTSAQGGALTSGRQKSCGCLQIETATKHGMEQTLIYGTWAQMKTRCLNPRHKSYPDYGGRGIKVCKRWLKFENFYADMGDKPPKTSIDRIDNDGNYEPGNCRWAPMLIQQNNRRSIHFLTFNGCTQSIAAWGRELGISPISIKSRITAKWSAEKILTTPIDSRKSTKRKPSKE